MLEECLGNEIDFQDEILNLLVPGANHQVAKTLTIEKTLEEGSRNPVNIRRDEGVFRLRPDITSSRCLEDVLIKMNIFALVISLHKTSSRRLQDVLQKSLQGIFKTPSRPLEAIFKASSKAF